MSSGFFGKNAPTTGTNLIEASHSGIEFAMANGRASTVLHYIRTLVAAPHAGARSDGALLEQFIRRRHEEAFATMVQRYGGLVLSVCRRVPGHEQRQTRASIPTREGATGRAIDPANPRGLR